jgi:hypothetical protein
MIVRRTRSLPVVSLFIEVRVTQRLPFRLIPGIRLPISFEVKVLLRRELEPSSPALLACSGSRRL